MDKDPLGFHKKQIDLHESEWHHEKKREPIFGPGAMPFLAYTIGALISYPIAKFLVIDVLGW